MEVIESMQALFSPESAQVWLVGGHSKGQPLSLSSHVQKALQGTGFKNIDRTLHHRFEGRPITTRSIEQQLVREGQCFRMVGLAIDLERGLLISHTDISLGEEPPAPIVFGEPNMNKSPRPLTRAPRNRLSWTHTRRT